jgi:hypothetical protein
MGRSESGFQRASEGSPLAGQWVRHIGIDLKAGKVEQVLGRLKHERPRSPQLRVSLDCAGPLLYRKRRPDETNHLSGELASYKFPRNPCSRSMASNSALKLPLPKLRLPLRWMTS